MWPSDQDNYHGCTTTTNTNAETNTNTNTNRVLSSSSSSRTSPSSTSSTLLPNFPAPKRRTMEDVWKDVSLCSLHHHRDSPVASLHKRQQQQCQPPTTSRSLRGMIFQDFLAGPLNRPHAQADQPPPAAAEESPLPPTVLSLTPGMEIQFLAHDAHANTNSNSVSTGAYNAAAVASLISPAFSDNVVGPPSPIGLFSFYSKKDMPQEDPTESGDRRHKRIMKNRESAARSRARKQAYINELELEVAQLLEENSRLNKELEELRLAMTPKNTSRKMLQRSSTAPF